MKKLNSFLIVLMMLYIVSCSSDDNDSDNNKVSGTIQLSGPDTSFLGNSLQVGNIDVDGLDTTGTSRSVTLLDVNTTIEGGKLIHTDFSNAFVIVVTQFTEEDNTDIEKGISMAIVKNGEDNKYACLTPVANSNFTACGAGFNMNKAKKEIVFDNTTVINTDSGTILTMNGTITWD